MSSTWHLCLEESDDGQQIADGIRLQGLSTSLSVSHPKRVLIPGKAFLCRLLKYNRASRMSSMWRLLCLEVLIAMHAERYHFKGSPAWCWILCFTLCDRNLRPFPIGLSHWSVPPSLISPPKKTKVRGFGWSASEITFHRSRPVLYPSEWLTSILHKGLKPVVYAERWILNYCFAMRSIKPIQFQGKASCGSFDWSR